MASNPERKSAKQAQIRAAARRLFIERGVASTSTDALAAAAGVSKRTLYAYYPSKELLLQSVLEELIAEPGQRELALASSIPEDAQALRDALATFLRAVLTTLLQPDYIGLARVIIAEIPRMPELGALFRETVPRRVLNVVMRLLEHGQERGLVSFPSAETAARMAVGALLTHVVMDGLLVGDGPPRSPPLDRVDEIVGLLLQAGRPNPAQQR
ncbi:TetR/AcrR family transcriptional regulator [Sorangium sp. So ce1078]|uniref:TetR/AcrR family transcriptional regulator n=1 Tax=Sorangium sp. So ce1078 TaxID=3133329 RepID=UPI003F5FD9FB